MFITILAIIFWIIFSVVCCVGALTILAGLSYLYADFAKTAKENNLYKRY